MDEVSRLKKIIENRENTIGFLNELLDGQSRKIEELENRLSDSEADYTETVQDSFIIDGLKEENENLSAELEHYKKVALFFSRKSDKLSEKLQILLNAFNEIKEDDLPKKKVTNEKEQHTSDEKKNNMQKS